MRNAQRPCYVPGSPDHAGISRRDTLKLAAAVAALGVAMGVRPADSIAQGKTEGKMEGKGEGKAGAKGEGKVSAKREGKAGAAGVYGDNGTVADYLAGQGLAPYFAMGDRYGLLYERMVSLLERLAPDEAERRAERRAEVDEMDAGVLATSFFDVDATVTAYCRDRSLAVPSEIDALIDLHVRAVAAWLDDLEARLVKP